MTHLAGFGAFVDVGCGVVSMIGIENCSVSRISHPARRFTVGQEIYTVLTGTDRSLGRLYLSHKELLGTWQENAARFSPGMTVTGWVRGVQPWSWPPTSQGWPTRPKASRRMTGCLSTSRPFCRTG